jgi:hypothetical protein
VSRTEAAVRVRRAIGLALEKLLRGELVQRLAVRAEGKRIVLNLAGHAVANRVGAHRLKPVSVDSCLIVLAPRKNGSRNLIGLGLGPSVVLEDCGRLALRLEIFVRDSASEDLGAKLGVERVGRHHTSGATSER